MNRVCELLHIKYPVVQGGMVWCSGWELASAVSNAGGLGLLGAGSMRPDDLREQIRLCRAATANPFGVNIPLMNKYAEEMIHICVEEKVEVVFTSAGNPKLWTAYLQEHGIKVGHVVSSARFAKKCEQAGVDLVVAEGFEAGGHNGLDETTTLCLIPAVRAVTSLPLLAAGGIASNQALRAVQVLGADGAQVGTLFALTVESAASDAFKKRCLELDEGGTGVVMRYTAPVRMIKNRFYDELHEAECSGAGKEQLSSMFGKGKARQGIAEGNLEEGALEIGQVASQIRCLRTVKEVMAMLVGEE